MIAELNGTFRNDIIFNLTHFEHGNRAKFETLSAVQRNTVREYLLLRMGTPDDHYWRPEIERALSEFWTDPV